MSKILAYGIDYGIDIGAGGANIIQESGQTGDIGKQAYNITGEVIGVGVNIALTKIGTTLGAGAATGPGIIVAVVIAVAQVVGTILDAVWSPFKNFYNSDLKNIRKSIKDELKKEFKTKRLNWPLEVKPNILGLLLPDDPEHETNIKEFQKYIKKYYDDNGLILQEDVLEEEKMFVDLMTVKRQSKKFIEDGNGNLVLLDPTLNSINIQDSDNNNMLLLLALAIYAKKKKLVKPKKNKTLEFFQYNWQMLISIFSLLILFFFCSMSIIGISI